MAHIGVKGIEQEINDAPPLIDKKPKQRLFSKQAVKAIARCILERYEETDDTLPNAPVPVYRKGRDEGVVILGQFEGGDTIAAHLVAGQIWSPSEVEGLLQEEICSQRFGICCTCRPAGAL